MLKLLIVTSSLLLSFPVFASQGMMTTHTKKPMLVSIGGVKITPNRHHHCDIQIWWHKTVIKNCNIHSNTHVASVQIKT